MVPTWQFRVVAVGVADPGRPGGGVGRAPVPPDRAVANLRRAGASMDTLVSVGTLAAFGWSLYALFLGHAGAPGLTHPFHLHPGRWHGSSQIYLEVAAGITTFVLAGRYAEARARRRSGRGPAGPARGSRAKDAAVLRPAVRCAVPVDQLVVGDHLVVRPGEKIATDGVVVDGSSAVDASLLTGESVPVEVSRGRRASSVAVSTSAAGSCVVPPRSGPTPSLRRWRRWSSRPRPGKAVGSAAGRPRLRRLRPCR